MPHRTRPMTALLVFTGLNAVLLSTITPVYDFVCFLPYWERRKMSPESILSAPQQAVNLAKVKLFYTSLEVPMILDDLLLPDACFCQRERRRLEREASSAKASGSA